MTNNLENMPTPVRRPNRHLTHTLPIFLSVLLLAGGLFTAYYLYINRQNPEQEKENVKSGEVADLMGKVGLLMELPTAEIPTVVTVLDKTKLSDQPFFRQAENGDSILIYSQTKKAILYSALKNKIIDVAPVSFDTPVQEAVSASTSTSSVKSLLTVAYYNGTTVAGLARITEKQLQQEFKNLQTVVRANASHSDYKGVTIVDLSGEWPGEVQKIAQVLGGLVGSLPKGEVRPDADVLVLIGK